MLRPGINTIREMTGRSFACRAAGLWSVEITEVGAEQNTMTIVMMPSEFVAMARSIAEIAKRP